jgi:hypothetical protein
LLLEVLLQLIIERNSRVPIDNGHFVISLCF